MRQLGCLAIAVALSAATIPSPASAVPSPVRTAPQAVRRVMASGVSVPILHLTQPSGVPCVAVKINSGGSVPWWGAINCGNGLAYEYKGTISPILLGLPAGATSERAYDIDLNGYVIGVSYSSTGVATPQVWSPGGAPLSPFKSCVAANVPVGIAAGFHKTGWAAGVPVVGQNLAGAPSQACWWYPGAAHLIPPTPTNSFAYDVNLKPIYVGQFNGTAAAGVGPTGPLSPIAGISSPSAAYAINSNSLVVGHEDLAPSGCGSSPQGVAFIYPYGGSVTMVAPLPGDCNAGFEDLNDKPSMVGYSLNPSVQQAVGYNLAAPYPTGLFDLNTGIVSHPWVLLSDAPGIDDANDIIATDTGVSPSQVYVLL